MTMRHCAACSCGFSSARGTRSRKRRTAARASGWPGVRRPDIVVLDILMPGHDGIETIRDLKVSHPGVAIIAMSGGGMIDCATYLRMATVLGAHATLTKPFSFPQLLSLVLALSPGSTIPA